MNFVFQLLKRIQFYSSIVFIYVFIIRSVHICVFFYIRD